MADRTWNAVDARLYDEDWSEAAILIMGMILAKCPNQYGVYKLPLGTIKRFFSGVLSESQPSVREALNELEKVGCIKRYRDGRVIWIIKKWGRDQYSKIEANRKAAIAYVRINYNEVYPEFERIYPLVPTKSQLSPNKGGTSDADAESESDSDKPKKAKKDSVTKKGKGKDKRDDTACGRWCILVKELWDEDVIIVDPVAKHIILAFNALGKNIEQFDKYVRNFLNDPWVIENRPGADHFYRNINKYAKPAKDVKPDIWDGAE